MKKWHDHEPICSQKAPLSHKKVNLIDLISEDCLKMVDYNAVIFCAWCDMEIEISLYSDGWRALKSDRLNLLGLYNNSACATGLT